MSVLSLSPQTLKITRETETAGVDGKPVITVEETSTDVPCRLDLGFTRIFANTVQGEMRANQIAGTLFLSGDAKDNEGNLLVLQYKDVIEIEGRKYEVINILPMRGYREIDHYEIAVVDYANK